MFLGGITIRGFMKTIRFETFETNSSSCHSLILVNKSDFEKFQKNEMVLHLGGFGVSDEYLEKRGWESSGGQDGKLLSWKEARDEYVKYVEKEIYEYGYESRLQDLKFINSSIKKPSDLTVDDFKKFVLKGSCLICGDFKTFENWKEGYSDWEYPNPSTWSENADGLIELSTNWRDG